jgi:hypothetical protein
MGQFAEKALEAAEIGSTVTLLLPSWPGYEWFQRLKQKGQVQDVIGPVRFESPEGKPVVLNNGRRSTSIVIISLGPKIPAGTNGPPIRKPKARPKGKRTNRVRPERACT